MLELENISFTYPHSGTEIFHGLSMRIEDGSFVSIIGTSGSGKTTLFRLLNGLETPSAGTIRLGGAPLSAGAGGKPLSGKKPQIERIPSAPTKNDGAHRTAYMPQQDMLFPWLTVEKNVMLPMTVQKRPKAECLRTAREMLARVGLSEWGTRYPRELSGGMRQRASFARTLCAGADLLLLDEPFSALDSITRISLQEWLLGQWNALRKTILFITHDVEEAIFLSRKVLVLTGHPVTKLQEYPVPLPDVRTREMLLRPEIAALREELIALLRQEAGGPENHPEKNQSGENQPEEDQSGGSQPEEDQSGGSQPEENHPEEEQSGESQPEENQPGKNQPDKRGRQNKKGDML